ncbi:MAG: mechanosensitive ion channel [Coleofasciculaceae cyanobacterium]
MNKASIVPIVKTGVLPWAHPVLAQERPDFGLESIFADLGPAVVNLIGALLILVIGIIVAWIAAAVVKGLLKRTNIDNKIAGWFAAGQTGTAAPPVEKWIAKAVFWIIILFTVVAVLQQLQLDAVSVPLNSFLEVILDFLPKIAGAGLLLAVAWLLASVVKLLVTRALRALNIDDRLNQQVNDRPNDETLSNSATQQFSLAETIGNAAYWFIFLLFLPSVLSTLELEGTLLPVQQLLNEVLAILPNILAAVLIAAIGWLVAQVVRRVVTNLLAAAGTDQLGARFGLTQTGGAQSLSSVIGTIVYALILIPVAIAALNTLQIEAISAPAIAMLDQILSAIPNIIKAALILVVAYALGRLLAELVTNILTGLGFNNVFRWLGISSVRVSRTTPVPPPVDQVGGNIPPSMEEETTGTSSTLPTRTPSEFVGIIVLVGIVLFGLVAAIEALQIEALTLIVGGLIVIFGQILAGVVVFAIGLYLANLAFNLIVSSGSRQSRILGNVARIAIIAFSGALALQQIGIAPEIVNLAFGLLLGAVAVAVALSFGLGTRDIAAGQVRDWMSSFYDRKRDDQL